MPEFRIIGREYYNPKTIDAVITICAGGVFYSLTHTQRISFLPKKRMLDSFFKKKKLNGTQIQEAFAIGRSRSSTRWWLGPWRGAGVANQVSDGWLLSSRPARTKEWGPGKEQDHCHKGGFGCLYCVVSLHLHGNHHLLLHAARVPGWANWGSSAVQFKSKAMHNSSSSSSHLLFFSCQPCHRARAQAVRAVHRLQVLLACTIGAVTQSMQQCTGTGTCTVSVQQQ